MKKVIFLVVFIFTVLSFKANSQILIGIIFGDKLNTDYLQMGFTIGDNLTTLTNIEGDYAHNIALGLDLMVFPKKKFNLHTGLFFSSPVSKKGLKLGPTGDPNLDTVLLETDVRLRLSYFSLPIYAKYKIGKTFSIEAGANISLMRKAKLEHTYLNSDQSLNYTENIRDDFNRWDVQAGIGIGYTFKQGEGTTINIRYLQGLLDVLDNDARKEDASKSSYNQVFQLLLEIPIKGDTSI
jgi:Outer membrane protein beta-barrel domain